jgi:GR25 family glycosyltransferase involved in LPS biosynthesis
MADRAGFANPIDFTQIPVFCINLDRRPDRWTKFSDQPGAAEFPTLRRFSAIDGRTIRVLDNKQISLQAKSNIIKKTRRSHDEIDTVGAVGASMSHTTVWRQFLQSKAEYALVFEDDTKIPPGLPAILAACSKERAELPSGFDLWLLHYAFVGMEGAGTGSAAARGLLPLTKTWSAPQDFYSFAGYVISRRGAERLLEDAFPVEMHIDRFANKKAELGLLDVVVHNRVRLGTRGSKSDIQVGGCRICKIPNQMDAVGMRAVPLQYLLALLGYSALVSVLLLQTQRR